MVVEPWSSNWRGVLSTVDLLIMVSCFVKKVHNIFNTKRCKSELVAAWRSTVLTEPSRSVRLPWVEHSTKKSKPGRGEVVRKSFGIFRVEFLADTDIDASLTNWTFASSNGFANGKVVIVLVLLSGACSCLLRYGIEYSCKKCCDTGPSSALLHLEMQQRAQYLMQDNLEVVWVEFSTLS